MSAVSQRLQTRLAAEAGIEKVLLGLRAFRTNVPTWYSNPEELNRILVWTPGEDESLWATNEELDEGTVAYRFSIVADDPFDDEERSRYGITDESAKLNINTAERRQLMRLIGQIATEDMVVEELVDALLDWRDEDDTTREFGAEADHYALLETPYQPKNGTFDTVEELLLVKGFDGRVLYGEDYDRNGLLGPNEDDGDESFPLDDGDGQLNRGLNPYITVLSRDFNTDSMNRPRAYLYGDQALLRDTLNEVFAETSKVEFIISTVSSGGSGDGQNGPDGNGGDGADGKKGEDAQSDGLDAGTDGAEEGAVGRKRGRRAQAVREDGTEEEDDPAGGEPTGEPTEDEKAREDSPEGSEPTEDEKAEEDAPKGGEPTGCGDGSGQLPTLNSPADLLTIAVSDGASPLTIEDLPALMDRTTAVDPLLDIPGLINVLTAPPRVLRLIPGLGGEEAGAIVQARGELTEEAAATTAWLVTQGVVSLETYQRIAPYITVQGRQFTIESIGFADHVGATTRLQVIVEMRGTLGQVLYYRDLTKLGTVFPIRENEAEYGLGGSDG
ncbi:MAG: hypothetical protein GY778_00220 [bacterium]|nr:hypothetical protein [bacterium]